MDLASYRRRESLTQQDVADRLGLSKSHISNIESGNDVAGLRLALQIEDLTDGVVPAEGLIVEDDSRLLAGFIARRMKAAA